MTQQTEGQRAAGGQRILRLALAEMAGLLGDVAVQMDTACRLAREAAAQGARVILFPEGCLTGNAMSGREKQAAIPADPAAFQALSEIAAGEGITICAGFTLAWNRQFNVAHAIVEPRGGVRFQHKSFRAFGEPAHLAAWPDPERVVFTVDGVRMAIAICSEFGTPAVRVALDRARVDLVLHPSAGCMKPEQVRHEDRAPTPDMDRFDEECSRVIDQAAEQARRTGVPKAGANPLGFDGETWWPGNSYAIDAQGRVAFRLKGENRPARMQPRLGVGDLPV